MMTPELNDLPEPLPPRLRWSSAQRRTAWLYSGETCVGSLGFGGYGRASGLTSRGVWQLHRRGVLQQGVHLCPADGRPPLLLRQPWAFDGEIDMPGGDAVGWRALDGCARSWVFERVHDRASLMTFRVDGALHADITVEVEPSAATLSDPTPLLLLGAFLVRLAVDDAAVIAGAV